MENRGRVGLRAGGLALALFASLWLAMGFTGCTAVSHANGNIAFMGDSITAYWWLPQSNLGVPGNGTTQMLERFPVEVLGQGYRAVVILGGTNDIRPTSDAIEVQVTEATSHIEQMAQMAEKEHLTVVLCAIPPIVDEDGRAKAMNDAIKGVAQKYQLRFVDYYTPMVGHPEYFGSDGIHPNQDGYVVMQEALAKVLPLEY